MTQAMPARPDRGREVPHTAHGELAMGDLDVGDDCMRIERTDTDYALLRPKRLNVFRPWLTCRE